MSSELRIGAAPVFAAPGRSAGAPAALRLPGTGHDNAAGDAGMAHASAATDDVLSRAARRVADALGSGNGFSFNFDRQTGMTIVRVINKATGELVRQIPTEEVVRIAQLLRQEEHSPVLDVLA
ncbi:MAG: flagellar protein FlaG [Steroidobacteraceae bacterium]